MNLRDSMEDAFLFGRKSGPAPEPAEPYERPPVSDFQQRLEKALRARDVLFDDGIVDGPVADIVLAVEAVVRDAVRSRYRRGVWLRLLGVEDRCIAARGDGAVCGKKPGHLGEHYFEAGA